MQPISLRSHGKCILAGEHTVVRGGEALVLPLRSRSLELSCEPLRSGPLAIDGGPFTAPFENSLSRALELTGFRMPSTSYSIRIRSDIPVQAGLGSSAALAVSVVRFLSALGAEIADSFALALEIENIFHGKSSGIDIACVLASEPICYRRGAPAEELQMNWLPHLYLFDTGLRSATKDCVAKVERAQRTDLDERMLVAVQKARHALRSDSKRGFGELREALQLAASCFEEWGLGPSSALVKKLEEAGAAAIKPTGSGGGGYLLTLWEKAPPAEFGLIPVWENS